SMRKAIDETARRREIQMAYNEEHGVVPKTIVKEIRDLISISKKSATGEIEEVDAEAMTKKERQKLVKKLEKEMQEAAAALDFEGAAQLRDMVLEIRAMD
ncbi:MAG: UvrB/UvrC motif-containing protein, partial [Lactococcus sp.]